MISTNCPPSRVSTRTRVRATRPASRSSREPRGRKGRGQEGLALDDVAGAAAGDQRLEKLERLEPAVGPERIEVVVQERPQDAGGAGQPVAVELEADLAAFPVVLPFPVAVSLPGG